MSVTPGIVGCVLAGGRATRMGGHAKAGLTLGGRPLLTHVVDRLRPQVETLIVNMDPDAPGAATLDPAIPIVPDTEPEKPGPLAGILAALLWCRERAPTLGEEAENPSFLVTVPVDAPFLPADLVRGLEQAFQTVEGRDAIVLAASNGRLHPVFGLWPLSAAEDLQSWLRRGENRSVRAFAGSFGVCEAPFAPIETALGCVDPFFNVNTPDDLAEAETHLPLLR